MANFINPLSSIGGFQNQALTRFTRPQMWRMGPTNMTPSTRT